MAGGVFDVPDLVEAASAILTQSERRVEIVAQNIANATTPGYKRRIAFSQLVANGDGNGGVQTAVTPVLDNRAGKLVVTNSPFDFALSGPGVFALRDATGGTRYSRQGRFSRDGDGHLVDVLGGALQLANGSDLTVTSADFEVRPDGSVIQKGELQGKLAVFAEADLRGVRGPDLIDTTRIQQGAFESSNVSIGDEMVLMMEALRRAESAQRVMITYDELMARVINTFGGNGQ